MFSSGTPLTARLLRSFQGWILLVLLVIAGSGVPAQACPLVELSPSSAQQPLEEDEDCGENALDEAKLPATETRIPGRGDSIRLVDRHKPEQRDARVSVLHSASTSGGESSRRNGFGSSLRC